MFSENIQVVTAETFDQEVLKSDRLVVVDFWGTHCGPCKMIKPRYEQLALTYGDRAKFVAVNIEDNKDLAKALGLRSMPTFHVYRGGETVFGTSGIQHFQTLESFIKASPLQI